jgi:predicted permease
MLVLLGLQLQKVEWSHKHLHLIAANGLRLLVAPAIALVLTMLFNLQGSARQATIIEASMPCAVTATVLATEFDVHPEFVTAAVTTSTLLSPLTLTPLLAFLGA